MLTADLVIAVRRKEELTLPALTGKLGDGVRFWAEQVLDSARGCVGLPRQEYTALVQVMGETMKERRIARGLCKLLEDACDFDEANPEESITLRRELFLTATQSRQAGSVDSGWDRGAVVEKVCANLSFDPSRLDTQLYADLPGAQRLLKVPNWTPDELLTIYDSARIQAVLLRAVQVRVNYRRTTALQLRALFRQLKFRRLLHQSERVGEQGLCLTIDGPYSLFESVTKYGLQLALLMPALCAAGPFELQADIQWGARREPLRFRHIHNLESADASNPGRPQEQAEYPDELQQLLADLSNIPSRFEVIPATSLIDLPGMGVCVPDLTFIDRSAPDKRIHFEMLGYWSRASVWKRVQLVQTGLREPVLFGVNQRLRVSEEVLDRKASGALYVFRGRPNAKTLLDRVERLASRERD